MHQEIQNCLEVLKKGGVILYPTDTVWGLGCHACDSEAIEKIFSLKRRPEAKSLIILLADMNELYRYVKNPPELAYRLIELNEDPLTIIYDEAINLPEKLISIDKSVAIRIVKHPFCRQLIHRLGKPLVSTSANFSGEKTPRCFNEITPALIKGVDYVVNVDKDKICRKSSSIIKLSNNGVIKIIRK